MMHRFPTGVSGEKVHQKRVPAGAPPWLETVRVHFPRYGLHADELCVTELADVIWAVQMSTVEFHPWNSRRADVEKPDEWRIDLDPMPTCTLATVRRVAARRPRGARRARRGRLAEDLRRQGDAHLRAHRAVARVRRRALAPRWRSPARSNVVRTATVTTTWWRKDRDPTAVFVDYNQNARDHTMAAAYSVRGRARRPRCRHRSRGTRSTPSSRPTARCRPFPAASPSSATCTPASTERSFAIDELLEWAARDERAGAVDPGTDDEP